MRERVQHRSPMTFWNHSHEQVFCFSHTSKTAVCSYSAGARIKPTKQLKLGRYAGIKEGFRNQINPALTDKSGMQHTFSCCGHVGVFDVEDVCSKDARRFVVLTLMILLADDRRPVEKCHSDSGLWCASSRSLSSPDLQKKWISHVHLAHDIIINFPTITEQ